ncbi:MAG: Spy/CpxP family protein refolding chaperone [Terriglobia bacterium]
MKAKLALVCAGLVFLANAALAQRPLPPQPPQPPQAPRPRHDPLGENLFPPELVMRHQKAIGLEPEQKSYLRDQIRQAQLRFTELQWELQDAMETVQSLLEQTQVAEEQVLAQLEKVLAAERAIKRTQLTLMIRIKNKLTPEQQARLRALRQKGIRAPRLPRPPPTPPAAPGPTPDW